MQLLLLLLLLSEFFTLALADSFPLKFDWQKVSARIPKKVLWLFSAFGLIWIMILFRWSLLILLFLEFSVPLIIICGLFRAHQLHLHVPQFFLVHLQGRIYIYIYISLVRIEKFLAQFTVDQLPHLVMSSLLLFLLMWITILSLSPLNIYLLLYCIFSIFALWHCFVIKLEEIQYFNISLS